MFIILFLIVFTLQEKPSNITVPFPNLRYGRYCGLNHYDPYGRPGINSLDEACHIHDICTTRGLTDCFCNQQLYWYISNIRVAGREAEVKNTIMRWIYYAIAPCSNYHTFNRLRVVGPITIPGFNYLPFYSPAHITISQILPGTLRPLRYLPVTTETYLETTKLLYHNTTSFTQFRSYPVTLDSSSFYVKDAGILWNSADFPVLIEVISGAPERKMDDWIFVAIFLWIIITSQ